MLRATCTQRVASLDAHETVKRCGSWGHSIHVHRKTHRVGSTTHCNSIAITEYSILLVPHWSP